MSGCVIEVNNRELGWSSTISSVTILFILTTGLTSCGERFYLEELGGDGSRKQWSLVKL